MAAGVAGNGAPGQRSAGPNALGAITAIPFTGLIDANCRFTVYSRSSTNGPVRSYISIFVLEVQLLLYQPWPPPSSARRLLVLRHGPSARLQGVAIFTGYEPPVQRSAYGRRDPRFDFCRRDPRFRRTPLRRSLSACLPCGPTDAVSRSEPEPALRQPSSSAPARSQIWTLWTRACIPRIPHLRTLSHDQNRNA